MSSPRRFRPIFPDHGGPPSQSAGEYQGWSATLVRFLEKARSGFIASGKGKPAQNLHFFELHGLPEGWETLPHPTFDTQDFISVTWKPGGATLVIDVENKKRGDSSTFLLNRDGSLKSYHEDMIEPVSTHSVEICLRQEFGLRGLEGELELEERKAIAQSRVTSMLEALIKCGALVKMVYVKDPPPRPAYEGDR